VTEAEKARRAYLQVMRRNAEHVTLIVDDVPVLRRCLVRRMGDVDARELLARLIDHLNREGTRSVSLHQQPPGATKGALPPEGEGMLAALRLVWGAEGARHLIEQLAQRLPVRQGSLW
jgi:hypothetical protein